jgi:hypothetical protein
VNLVAIRNVAIILAISAAVYFVPGGGATAAAIKWALLTAFAVALCWGLTMIYRQYRSDLHALGDTGRALLYGGIGGLVVAAAGTNEMLRTSVGVAVWLLLIGASIYALMLAWRRRGLA